MTRLSVRLRVTLMAAVVIAVTVLVGSVLLLEALEDRLLTDVRAADAASLQAQVGMDIRIDSYLTQEVVEVAGVVGSGDDLDQLLADFLDPGLAPSTKVLVSRVALPDGTTGALATSLAPLRSSLDATRTLLWIAGPVLVGVVAVLAWLMVGRALRPVHALTATASQIKADALHERLPVPLRRDEIHELAVTVNSLLERLESATATNRQLVSDASHELRTPLSVIANELAVAERHGGDPTVVLDRIRGETRRLSRLVDDLLLLNRLGEPAVALRPVSLADIVRDVGSRRRRVPVEITFDGADDHVVTGDETALSSAIDHLVANATRHAASGVALVLTRDAEHLRLTVDDDGAGIPPADRLRVLERFVRLDEARSRDGGGAGLGLSVADDVIRRHRGTLVIDDSPAGGTRVAIALPAMCRR